MDCYRRPAILVVILLAMAGCGEPPREPVNSRTASPPPTPTTGVTPPGTSLSPPVTVLRGRVQEGMEAGCLVLSTGQGQFLLLGGDEGVLRAGAEVVVEGSARPGQATTCQQGTPFAVTEARTAPTTR
jgi:hypothetical protein